MDLEDLSNEKLLAFDRRGRQGEDMPTNKFTLAENKASAPFKLKSTDALALDFDKLDKKGLKSLVDRFKRRKRPVSDIETNNRAKRANGVLQKQFTLTFEDGQKLTFAIKSDGTIFQVKLNNKVMPLRNTTDMTKAVEELVNAMLANSSAYEKAKAAYDQSQAAMVKVRRNLEYATITSPIDGVIINKVVEEGQTVAAGFETPTLFTIAADLTKMQVIADVDEADIGGVKEGQRVTFTVDAYPEDIFEGTVTQVRLGESSDSSTSASSSSSSSTVVTYEVVISAENPDLKLKPRLTANVTIYTMERQNVLTVPNKSLRFVPDMQQLQEIGLVADNSKLSDSAGKRMVWIKQNNVLKPQIVEVGTSDSNVSEIKQGLSEGDEVAVEISSVAMSMPQEGQSERSPFMPGPPGGNKKEK